MDQHTQQQEVHGSTVTFSRSSLSNYTYYYWKVTVSDGKGGTATLGSGYTRTKCPTTSCSGPSGTSTCTKCSGTGEIAERCDNVGTYTTIRQSGNTLLECSGCGDTLNDNGYYNVYKECWCSKCNYSSRVARACQSCKEDYNGMTWNCNRQHDETSSCTSCGGDGLLGSATCSHGKTSSHYYCTTHNYSGSATSHS